MTKIDINKIDIKDDLAFFDALDEVINQRKDGGGIMTPEAFADLLGVSRPSVQRWLNGTTVPHPALRPAIYSLLNKIVEDNSSKIEKTLVLNGRESSLLALLAQGITLSSKDKRLIISSLGNEAAQIAEAIVDPSGNHNQNALKAAQGFIDWANSIGKKI